jgi:hypothetical protein
VVWIGLSWWIRVLGSGVVILGWISAVWWLILSGKRIMVRRWVRGRLWIAGIGCNLGRSLIVSRIRRSLRRIR